jgi:hypothetical protein
LKIEAPILKIEAPRLAAEVRNPARKCPRESPRIEADAVGMGFDDVGDAAV